jgi:uncharacterized protein YgbK (DUF1537 family)
MSEIILNKEDCFNALPPEWDDELLPSIRNQIKESLTKIVILDDDPTGTQTIHDLPVLTTWDVDSLKKELKNKSTAFFILTNSRGMTKPNACILGMEIGLNLKRASGVTGIKLSVISRSDSTLRGHFPFEVDEVAMALGDNDLPYLICPFFLEGGRFTIHNVHYVAEGNQLIPVARTSYAQDATFGFNHSNLCQWVEEKTEGRIPADKVIPISLDDIRKGGPRRVTHILMEVPYKSACIVNAVSYKDIEVFVAGLLNARVKGKRFLCRTAASFVRVRTGIAPQEKLLSKTELVSDVSTGGLFVVGSYVPKTTAQVTTLIDRTDIFPIEINVDRVLEKHSRDKEIEIAKVKVNAALKKGRDSMIYTSRNLVTGNDPDTSLKIGQAISSGLIEIVKGLSCQPRYLVAKGGITASDVATKGLKVERALVLGQVLPGVPVWKLGEESLHPGMSYIIFPGNVGKEDALVTIKQILS